jgi:protease secretion system membrane fusion protein
MSALLNHVDAAANATAPAAQNIHYENAVRAARLGFYLLILGLGGFLLWASLAPLDEGVVGSGTVVISGERKTVQSALAGTVDQIQVREGENVQQGQVLVHLNTLKAQAEYDVALGQWLGSQAKQARLIAERLGTEAIKWPDDLVKHSADARASGAMELQRGLFTTRRAELKSRLAILDHEKKSLQEQLVGYEEVRRNQSARLELQNQEIESLQALATKGLVPRLQLNESQRQGAELSADLAEAVSNIARTKQSINESRMKDLQAKEAFRSEVESELSEVAGEVSALTERLKALEFELNNAAILAPVSGQVVGLNVHTRGGVLTQGQHLMDIVPESSHWIVKAQFPPLVADKLRIGLPVDIRFGSLKRVNTPVLQGTVATVSADRLLDEITKEPYFGVEVAVGAEVERVLNDAGLKVKPGMQAEVIVKTGERTLFNYLMQPVREKMAGALTEE